MCTHFSLKTVTVTVSPAVTSPVDITAMHIRGSLLPGVDRQALQWASSTVLLSGQRWDLYLALEGGLARKAFSYHSSSEASTTSAPLGIA